jgi:hypothetical protein
VTTDEKFKPDVGLAMAKELVLKEGVDILMATINSATALAVSDFAKKGEDPDERTNDEQEYAVNGNGQTRHRNGSLERVRRGDSPVQLKKDEIHHG